MALSDITAQAGSIMRIAAALPATHDKSGFEALTWLEVGLTDDLGELGKTFGLATFTPTSGRGTVKRKTSFNNGSLSIRYAHVAGGDDAGQAAVDTAGDSDDYVSFGIETPAGEAIYFTGLVMGGPVHIGTVEDIITKQVTIEVSESAILFEDAPASW